MKNLLPWKIKVGINDFRNRLHYYRNLYFNKTTNKPDLKKKIVFICGFHGKTGGVQAIANIANMLSIRYNVKFISFPGSNYNKLLKKSVSIITRNNFDADIYICDVTCDHDILKTLRKAGKKIIVSCHGLLNALHGLKEEVVLESLRLADNVHFVNQVQQESFKLDKPKYSIIQNTHDRIIKTKITNSVGIIGNILDKRKNIKQGIEIALKSQARKVHIWGSDKGKCDNSKVNFHEWSTNKKKIFDSFDVLVSMSRIETFGLVVAEALSAGIPCLLSNISAFRQFSKCPGVTLVEDDDSNAFRILDELLMNKDKMRDDIVQFWKENYSENIVSNKWTNFIESMR